ncbi:MAG: hypothetical protein JWO02_2826, partial [Solirubrobacterales bacterium]|nr:hypothetical protein [Solirubrobacterales bacterium]
AERQAAEAAAAGRAARKRRLSILGAIVAAAAVLVLVAVIVTSGGSDKKITPNASSGAAVAGVKESTAMLSGIPQSGRVLGNPKAPVTMLEFADLQCPICQEYTLQTMPRIVQNYVRSGKVKVELHLLTFIGDDSVRAAAVANAAARQDKLWNFADIFYYNQGQENTGYATDAFLRRIATATPGLDVTKAFAGRMDASVINENGAANSLAGRYGVVGTPTFVVGPTGGTLKTVSNFDLASVTTAIDNALKPAT